MGLDRRAIMLTVIVVAGFLVTLTVISHYEVLYRLTKVLAHQGFHYRLRIVFGVIGTLCAHIMEVMLFAWAYHRFHHGRQGLGELRGNFDGSYFDSIYFSFTTYTSLGFGDIEPVGYIRLLIGIEALTGLVMITWSASFLYLEMQRYWKMR